MASVSFINSFVRYSGRHRADLRAVARHWVCGDSPRHSGRRNAKVERRCFTRTRRSNLIMALPTAEAIRSTRFPNTASLAQEILMAAPDALNSEYLEVLGNFMWSSGGARGLFIAMLSQEGVRICDRSEEEVGSVVRALRECAEKSGLDVEGLVLKNVVMPTAMEYRYRISEQEEERLGSEMTRNRAIRVAATWGGEKLRKDAKDMVRALQGNGGQFEGFVGKFGYEGRETELMVESLVKAIGEEVLDE